MGCRVAVALALFGLGASWSTGAPARSRPHSLVTAGWSHDTPVPPCEPSYDCITFLRSAELVDAKALGGPPVPAEVKVHFGGIHSTPWLGSRIVIVLEPRSEGSWRALWLDQVEPGAEICYSRDWLREWKVPVPAGARKQADQICFRP